MSNMNLLESNQLNYLYPLNKWRFLDLQSLFQESQYPGSLSGFRKLILRLERKEIVQSFRSGQFGRKYVYLTKQGGSRLGLDEAALNVSTETLLHDGRVADIARSFLDFSTITRVELEHEIILARGSNTHLPDACFYGKRMGKDFRLAFELELTRKAKTKYLDKMSFYLNSNFYEYVLYFFQSYGIYESYKKHLESEKGAKAFEKIMFAINPNINKQDPRIGETTLFFRGKEVRLRDIFDQ